MIYTQRFIDKQKNMKKMHVLQIILVTLLFSACSLVSVERTQQSNSNQTVQSNNQIAQTSTKNIDENKSDLKSSNAFTNLDEQTNSTKSKPISQQQNAVCPHPDKPCRHKEKEFADWELSFRLPAKIAPNKTYSSSPFYAVMLKTYKSVEDCDGGEYIEAVEKERKRVQSLQLERKVFASYGCPNMDAVNYDFKGRMDATGDNVLIDNFIAIYAGDREEDSEELLRNVRDEYPKAVVKRMTANWERIEQ